MRLLFSYLSESSYIRLGHGGHVFHRRRTVVERGHSGLYWFLWVLSLVLIPIFCTDLVPRAFGEGARNFHLKTVRYACVTLVLGVLLYRHYRPGAVAPGTVPAVKTRLSASRAQGDSSETGRSAFIDANAHGRTGRENLSPARETMGSERHHLAQSLMRLA